MHSSQSSILVVGISLVYGVFLVLGGWAHTLWGDEAETALYARSILQYGVPRGWDGVNLMGFADGATLHANTLITSNPWPQYYLVAASFAVFGESSFAARLPFIFLAIISLPLLFLIAKQIGGTSLGLIVALLAATSVQYILFSYQARYFSIISVAALLNFYSVGRRERFAFLLFVGSGIVFIFSNYISFPFWYVSLFVSSVAVRLIDKDQFVEKFIKKYITGGILIAAVFLPWFLYFQPARRGAINTGTIVAFLSHFPSWFWALYTQFNNANVLPIGCIFLGVLFSKKLIFVGIFILIYFILVTIASMMTVTDSSLYSIRFHTAIIPIIFIGLGIIMRELWRWKKVVGGVACFIFITTNIWTFQKPVSFLYEYLREVIERYQTTDEVVSEFLTLHSTQGERAFVSLDRSHEPLVFFLGNRLKFINRVSFANDRLFPKNFSALPSYIYHFIGEPEWVILYGNEKNKHPVDWRPVPAGIDLTKYEKTVMPVSALDFSRPELTLHSFQPVKPNQDEMIYIYYKKDVYVP